MKPSPDCVPLADCIPRRLYKIRCRNLDYGVFDGKTGFIGIREKFGDLFLFTEYHHETGAPFGTVFGVIDTGIDLPEDIRCEDRGPTIDGLSRREVYFDKPITQGGRGWVFKDTDEDSEAIRPVGSGNPEMFAWLEAREAELGE